MEPNEQKPVGKTHQKHIAQMLAKRSNNIAENEGKMHKEENCDEDENITHMQLDSSALK